MIRLQFILIKCAYHISVIHLVLIDCNNCYCRFLAGEMSAKGVRTAGLVDTWSLAQSQENGFTFSALEGPSKKVHY